jgi:hypothetical protein
MDKQETKLFGYTNRQGSHWFTSDEYSHKEIENIPDPDGGESTSLPTAIPSPFARLDLVKTAFRNISNTNELRKETVKNKVIAGIEEEKLVSHSLDIAQLLFMSDTFAGKKNASIEIIPWDRKREIEELESGSVAHRRYAATLRLYLEQDKEAYNFDLFDTMYLVKFQHEFIGGTSPATLFFCTAKDLNHISIPITGNDRLFDDEYTPLYERDPQFQLYLYQLFVENQDLRKRMKELNRYLQRNEEILKERRPDIFAAVQELRTKTISGLFTPLTTGSSGEYVRVIGAQLYKLRVEHAVSTAADSDFVIESTYKPYELRPLVLQNSFNRPLKYIEGTWKPEYSVPYAESDPILQRSLPHQNLRYPYLTVSDMLEPYLIKLPYPIDPTKYYTGLTNSAPGSKGSQYLLPLTTEFFKFYAPEDLVAAGGSGRKPILEIKEQDKSVHVKLQLPIKKQGEYITFERTYDVPSYGETLTPDVLNNRGVVVEQNFGLTMFPFIKLPSDVEPHYRIQTVDADRHGPAASSRLKVRFYGKHDTVSSNVVAKQRRKKILGSGGDLGTDYYVVKSDIEYMQVYDESLEMKRGVVVPLWFQRPYASGSMKKFKFAVDFGTTNTHIEYIDGEGKPKPFDITPSCQQIAPLFYSESAGSELSGWSIELYQMILDELLPFKIGSGSEYRFPRRTVIAEGHDLISNVEHFALADYNIPFTYEIRSLKGMVFRTNLKWGMRGLNQDSMQERVDRYIETLSLLMRAKVLLNGGDLSSTEVVWFYPTSMTRGRRDDMVRAWQRHFQAYFQPKTTEQIRNIAESLAPYYHYRGSAAIQAAGSSPIVNIDIGGGTTDVVVFRQDRPVLQSSFKFAANAIFGDGFAKFGGSANSAFISRFRAHYDKLFDANKLEDLRNIMEEIVAKGRAQDIHAFFFSVSRHKDIKEPHRFAYDLELSKDEDLKIVFIYFLVAITYHVATLMKAREIGLPRYVTFSGTGSKVLSIITSNNKLLKDLTKKVFEDVYGETYGIDGLNLVLEPEIPKEVTCKGGLLAPQELDEVSHSSIYTTVPGREFEQLSYGDVEAHIPDVVQAIESFNEYFISLNKTFNMSDYFNVHPRAWKAFVSELPRDITNYVEQALQQERDESGVEATEQIAESPFFYGLKGTLYKMTNELSQLQNQN